MRTISLSSRKTAMAAAATLSLAVASLAGIALAPAANATAVAITLSAVAGPLAGGNSLTATSAANTFSTIPVVQFVPKASLTACPVYAAAVSPTIAVVSGTEHVLTAKKLAFTVPATLVALVSPATSASYLICVYAHGPATGDAAIASAAYTVATAPSIASSAASPAGVVPNGGPALGGGSVTINGTGFTAGTTAKIGSMALTGVVINSSTSLTGVVPAQAASATAMTVSVSNTGGTASQTLGTPGYTYSNGIVVSPNTAPTSSSQDVDIQGVGFSSLTFTTTDGSVPAAAGAHVYMVDGAYTLSGSAKTVGENGECENVLVISDNELICTVNTLSGAVASPDTSAASGPILGGTYTLTIVADGATFVQATANPSIVSSGSTFTVAPY